MTESNLNNNRRSFVAAMVAVGAGALAMLTPVAVGFATFLSPLFRKHKNHHVRVALLSQVPDDGLPRYFPVLTDREDAWNRTPQQRVGAVYLVRSAGEAQPIAFTAKCPHAGCFIGTTSGADHFKCPCHTSTFNLDGSRVRGDAEVSPRDMDRLPLELRKISTGKGVSVTEVWVEFIDFQTGHKQAIRTA